MKKLYTLFATLLLTAVSLGTLTSCEWDEDDAIAYTLEGTWEGKIYIKKYWERGHDYYDVTRSVVEFRRYRDTYSSGDGYWVDYYSKAPWDYVANHIRWRVDFRDLIIDFLEDGDRLVIRDYKLSSNFFSGYIEDGDNDVEFELHHTYSPNWERYDRWGWDDDYYDDYWRTRSGGDDSTATEKPKRFVFSE